VLLGVVGYPWSPFWTACWLTHDFGQARSHRRLYLLHQFQHAALFLAQDPHQLAERPHFGPVGTMHRASPRTIAGWKPLPVMKPGWQKPAE
jgi:hypothetical protein